MKRQRQTFSFGLRSWLAASTIFAVPAALVFLGGSFTRVSQPPVLATKTQLPPRAERVPNLAQDADFPKLQDHESAALRRITFKQPSNNESPRTPNVQSRQTTLTVTTIMATRDGAVAVIGGKVCRVGDTLDPGWTIERIDASAGQVVLIGLDGDRTTISLRSSP